MTTINAHDDFQSSRSNFEFFDLKSLAQACDQSQEWILQLIEYDILSSPEDLQTHQFNHDDLTRAQQAYRLQRDFNASFPSVAMMLDLIDEVQQLRREIKHLQLYKS